MKLLFKQNQDDESCDYLKELIGYLDADINFKNIKPDLITASNEVYDLIGKEVYIKAEAIFLITDELNDLQAEFLRIICYPIAIKAYFLYAPTNDLSHTNNGRKMRADDSQKTPFEWMLDRDNEAQEKRYYRALDDLIQFLDRLTIYTNPVSPEQILSNAISMLWKDSEAFKQSNSLFIRTVAEFDESFPIQSRLLLIKLNPGIKKCEREEIIPRISPAKYDDLKTKLKSATEITDLNDLKLLSLIRDACAYYSLSWSMMRYSVNLYPEGVLQYTASDRISSQSKKPALNSEPEAARQAFLSDFQSACLQIEQLLFVPEPVNPSEAINHKHDCNDDDKFFTA